MEEDLDLRINFLSTDSKIARNSHGEFFKIGDKVKHDGDEHNATAIINKFEVDIPSNEVKVYTSLGHCHLDFLYKKNNRNKVTIDE